MSEPRRETAPVTETDERTSLAPLYRVLVHNDDVTPMPFVVQILARVFRVDRARSEQIMLEAHHKGIAYVVTLPLEEAEVRCERAHAQARSHGYPLTFTYEPET